MAFRRNEAWEPGFRKSPEFEKSMAREAVGLVKHVRIAAEPSRNTGYFIRRIVPIKNRVHLQDPFWHLVEYGSVNNPAYSPARRGVLMAGMTFVDDGLGGV